MSQFPYRKNLLNLLVSYRMELVAKQDAEPDEQELVVQLSPLYLEQLEAAHLDGERQGEQRGEQIGKLKGRQDLLLRQLNRQVREMPLDVESQVRSLSTEQLDFLGEALLDFEGMSDLLKWLQGNEV
jgi:predicted transposase YdaD